ncbi:oxidoreductase [Achlya hypogyna]|uniref:Oxidoreductase n=1 Tax=Achlya hypogyna TaxID=1202772 RepID=A0A1V9ZHS7_ACHHY|nr:oxidoreductase [Achlya hypogyna]
MLNLGRLFALSVVAGGIAAASQCCFKDGDVISLKSDTGNFVGRCNNCIWNEAYDDSAFVHVPSPNSAPWAQWTVVNTGNGKIALRADTGKFLARCNNCAPWAAYPDEAFVHVKDWTKAPWAQWTCKEAGNGKIGLQADSGSYLARCNNCVGAAYSNAAFVHAKSFNDERTNVC